jgi:DNA-binding IclR family transcriptional regulator
MEQPGEINRLKYSLIALLDFPAYVLVAYHETRKDSMVTPARAKKSNGAQSIERAMKVLRIVAAATNGATLSHVVSASRLNKATAHRLLMVLTREGLVQRHTESKVYYPGEQLYALGILAAPRYGLHQLAVPGLRRLATLSEDSSFLCLLSGDDLVCVHREEGTHPIRTHVLQVGIRYPLGIGSIGGAMLAAMDNPSVERVLESNRAEIAKFPNYSVEKVRASVKATRAKGYCVNPGLVHPESYGIAVAILDERNWPIGSLSIGAVASRLQADRQPKLAAALKGEAAILSKQMREMRSKIAP